MSVAETGSVARQGMLFFKEAVEKTYLQRIKKAGKENAPVTPSALLLALREQRKQANEGKLRQADQEDADIGKLFEGSTKVKNGENIMTKEISEEDANFIEERVALQQKQFELHKKKEERRKIGKIMAFAWYLTEAEAIFSLLDCDEDEEESILRFADQSRDYLHEIRKRIAQSSPAENDDEETAYLVTHKQRERGRQKRQATKEDREKMKEYVYKRLSLNEAMAQLRTAGDSPEALEEAMKDWSPARRQAYKLIDENPNAYYYRFNAPGEEQRNGKWTAAEHALFMKRLEEKGADGEWGIFSMAIPGRVGYQCSNYYRSLIIAGRVSDPNYFIDEEGKIRYKFKSKTGDDTVRRFKRKVSKGSDDEDGEGDEKPKPKRERKSPKEKKQAAPKKATKGGKKKKGRKGSDSDASDDDFGEEYGQWKPKRSFYTTKRLRLMHGELNEEDKEEIQNPLPDFLDPITLTEVVMPAISPTGHVMSWSSWMQCIEHNGKCPLTKTSLKKEDLVILTPENIEEYRDKIVNMD